MTKSQFAKHIKFSKQYVCDVCAGTRTISLEFSARAGIALGIERLELISMQSEYNLKKMKSPKIKPIKASEGGK